MARARPSLRWHARAAIVGVLLSASGPLEPVSSIAAGQERGWSTALLEGWLDAVLQHVPGETDAPVQAAAAWAGDDLQALYVDVQVLLAAAEDPKRTRFRVRRMDTGLGAVRLPPITVTPGRAEAARLADLAKEVARRDRNDVVRRGVLLHTDVVTVGAQLLAGAPPPDAATGPIKLLVGDGNSRGVESVSLHWELARLAAGSLEARPLPDPFVRDWYRATVAFTQNGESFDSDQLRHGLSRFPDDPVLLLLAGCEREAFASPIFQAFARAVNSRFLRVPFGGADGELEAAARFFRRALAADPALVEARVRLGRVLGLQGFHTEAIGELERALDGPLEPVLEYYASLFLGHERESVRQAERAQEAYRRAASVAPSARVPHLALARGARELGRLDDMQASLQRALASVAEDEPPDPWWQYHSAQGRHADEWLTRLRQSFKAQTP